MCVCMGERRGVRECEYWGMGVCVRVCVKGVGGGGDRVVCAQCLHRSVCR